METFLNVLQVIFLVIMWCSVVGSALFSFSEGYQGHKQDEISWLLWTVICLLVIIAV